MSLQFWDCQALVWNHGSFPPLLKTTLTSSAIVPAPEAHLTRRCYVRALMRALTKSIITKSSWVFPVLLPLEPSECKLPCRGDSVSGESGGLTCPRNQRWWVLILWSYLSVYFDSVGAVRRLDNNHMLQQGQQTHTVICMSREPKTQHGRLLETKQI